MITDTLESRRAIFGKDLQSKTATKITVNINIVNTLPMMIMEDTLLDSNVIDLTPIPAVTDVATVKNVLMDPEYKENDVVVDRFVFMISCDNPFTYFKYTLWYDKKYKDIIVLPGTDLLISDDDTLSSVVLNLTGYRLGSGVAVSAIPDEMVIGMNEKSRHNLPVAKQNIEGNFYLSDFYGLNPIHNAINNYSYNEVFQDKNGKVYNVGFIKSRSEPVVILDLGLAGDVFESFDASVDKLPLYMVYQQGLTRYSYSYLGNVKPKSYRICVCLQF